MTETPQPSTPTRRGNPPAGQALVELILVAPILVALLMATFWMGAALHAGASVPAAVASPLADRFLLAGRPGDATPLVEVLAQQAPVETPGYPGPPLDRVQVSDLDRVTALILGERAIVVPLISNALNIQFGGVQTVPANLLLANQANPVGQLLQGPAGMDFIPLNSSPAAAGLVQPQDYGIDPADLPPDGVPMLSPDCAQATLINIESVNQAMAEPAYKITQFSPPNLLPPLGKTFSTLYAAPSEVSPEVLMDVPNQVCEQAYTTQYPAECAAELLSETTTTTTTAPTTTAETTTTAPSTTTEGTAATADPQTACTLKKRQACRLQLNHRFVLRVIQEMRNRRGCERTFSQGQDVLFPTTPPSY